MKNFLLIFTIFFFQPAFAENQTLEQAIREFSGLYSQSYSVNGTEIEDYFFINKAKKVKVGKVGARIEFEGAYYSSYHDGVKIKGTYCPSNTEGFRGCVSYSRGFVSVEFYNYKNEKLEEPSMYFVYFPKLNSKIMGGIKFDEKHKRSDIKKLNTY